MINLVEDVSKLTDVPDKTLDKFTGIIEYCIAHAICESCFNNNHITEIDVGFGEIHIKTDADGVRYRFLPSKNLEKMIVESIVNKRSPIIQKIDKSLQEKIDRAYKELI